MVYGTYNQLVTGAFVNQLTSLGGLTLYKSRVYVIVVTSITNWFQNPQLHVSPHSPAENEYCQHKLNPTNKQFLVNKYPLVN